MIEIGKAICPRCEAENVVHQSEDIWGKGRESMWCNKCERLYTRPNDKQDWLVVIDSPYPQNKWRTFTSDANIELSRKDRKDI